MVDRLILDGESNGVVGASEILSERQKATAGTKQVGVGEIRAGEDVGVAAEETG